MIRIPARLLGLELPEHEDVAAARAGAKAGGKTHAVRDLEVPSPAVRRIDPSGRTARKPYLFSSPCGRCGAGVYSSEGWESLVWLWSSEEGRYLKRSAFLCGPCGQVASIALHQEERDKEDR